MGEISLLCLVFWTTCLPADNTGDRQPFDAAASAKEAQRQILALNLGVEHADSEAVTRVGAAKSKPLKHKPLK